VHVIVRRWAKLVKPKEIIKLAEILEMVVTSTPAALPPTPHGLISLIVL
jgi:hypothetical protein